MTVTPTDAGGGNTSNGARLGDVWSSPEASRAFASKSLKSVDVASAESIRVCFRNRTPEALTLCWVSHRGEARHFYKLDPWEDASGEEGTGKRGGGEGRDDGRNGGVAERTKTTLVVREGGGHFEQTSLGHAFALARRADHHVKAKDRSRAEDGAIKEEDGDGGVLDVIPPPSPKRRVLDCLTLCGSPTATTSRSELRERDEDGRYLDPKDVVGGYRPTCVTLQSSSREKGKMSNPYEDDDNSEAKSDASDDEEDRSMRVHVVTVSRAPAPPEKQGWKRGLLRGMMRGATDESEQDVSGGCSSRWTYTVRVEEGTLDRTPIDTSDKIYRSIKLAGWSVRCEDGLWEDMYSPKKKKKKKKEPLLRGKGGTDERADDDEERKRAQERDEEEAKLKDMIEADLEAAIGCLPRRARSSLRRDTSIWINRSQRFGPAAAPVNGRGMCFHPDPKWLVENGMSAAKARGVEMYQVSDYLEDRDLWGKGGVLLHELSHAYHNKCVKGGYDNEDVRGCYERAMERGLYDCVRVHGRQGPECRAYACTDPMEYFAELSVAFLGGLDENVEHNKWFPFNRAQVRQHDPDAYEMLKRIWKVDDD